MSLSAGLSSSTSSGNASQISTGPVQFGAVNIGSSPAPVPLAAPLSTMTWLLLAGAALAAVLLLRK